MAEQVPPNRVRLGIRLREIRARKFRSGSALARAFDPEWQQTKVSKLELGRQLPSEREIDQWLSACDAEEFSLELHELLALARLNYRSWGHAWRTPGGIAAMQDDIAELDAQATLIAEYQPSMIPGLVQTPAYAREALAVAGGPSLLGADANSIDERINAQLRRQQILYTPGKTIQLVIGEAALWTRFGDAATLAGQLDRLATLAELPNLDVGVLPFDRPSPVLPLTGFAINDKSIVWVETLTGEQRLDDPAEVEPYVAAFEAILAAALVGDDAIALIRGRR